MANHPLQAQLTALVNEATLRGFGVNVDGGTDDLITGNASDDPATMWVALTTEGHGFPKLCRRWADACIRANLSPAGEEAWSPVRRWVGIFFHGDGTMTGSGSRTNDYQIFTIRNIPLDPNATPYKWISFLEDAATNHTIPDVQ